MNQTPIRLSFLFLTFFFLLFNSNILPQDLENPNADATKKEQEEESYRNDQKNSFGKSISNFFGKTLGLKEGSQAIEKYIAKSMKPTKLLDSKHRLILTPFNFISKSTYSSPEQQENFHNAYYASFQSQLTGQKNRAVSRPQHGSGESNYNQIEYRFYERLRLFYINRNTKESWSEGPSSLNVYEYKDKLTGQLKNYSTRERQERFGAAYYHPLTTYFNLGAIYSKYNIQQSFTANGTTIIGKQETGFSFEGSKHSMTSMVPGFGIELFPVKLISNAFNFVLKNELSFFNQLQIIYSQEFLQASSRRGIPEVSFVGNFSTDPSNPPVVSPTIISPIYTLDRFNYRGGYREFCHWNEILKQYQIHA